MGGYCPSTRSAAICLCACYAMSSTDRASGAICRRNAWWRNQTQATTLLGLQAWWTQNVEFYPKTGAIRTAKNVTAGNTTGTSGNNTVISHQKTVTTRPLDVKLISPQVGESYFPTGPPCDVLY
eukprot:2492353-Rhodomonas_salina.2